MGKENNSSADLYTASDTSVSATTQQKYLRGVTPRVMAGRNAKRGWWCLFRDWRSQVHPKVKLLFCSSTKNCYVHCSMMYDVWNDSNGALCSTQSLLPMGTWQKYPRFSPLSFKASASVASLARTLCHSALKNASLCFSNHRVPTGRDMGAIRTAHISASSNAACWLLISLQQMV